MAEIVPAILAKSIDELEKKINAVQALVSRIHIDVADDIFVRNLTIGPNEIDRAAIQIPFLVHLMVNKPENHIIRWLDTNADTFIFHAEATTQPELVIGPIKEKDDALLVGVALNPGTPASAIEQYIDGVDIVQFMTVEPGFYGSPFVDDVIKKIKEFRYFYPDKIIAVDGAITPDKIKELVSLGIDTFVVGSYIFNAPNIEKALEELEKSIE